MMMEEEIDRTKEDIQTIENACDNVENILNTVTASYQEYMKQSQHKHLPTPTTPPDHRTDGTQMEGIILPQQTEWYENEELLNLWHKQ